jgi:Raf kinase inhibitor-like YbhB/YbcL family protein
MRKIMAFLIVVVFIMVGCGDSGTANPKVAAMKIKSFSFDEGQPIPVESTCDGSDISPQISWGGVPMDCASLALICQDPDAPSGVFTHWIVYDIKPVTPRLLQGQPKKEEIVGEARQGMNDFDKMGWNGPCPPAGKPHKYVFTVYALDARIGFAKTPKYPDFEKAIKGHVIGKAQMTGTYQKK